MSAVTIFLKVIFVALCCHLVKSSHYGGDLVLPGPNTYTFGGRSDSKVSVRRVSASKSPILLSENSSRVFNGTNTFGELTPNSIIAL